jgi:hypothetical protein
VHSHVPPVVAVSCRLLRFRRWNTLGWVKAIVIWNFVLSAALGVQRFSIQVGLGGLLPGARLPPSEVPVVAYYEATAMRVLCRRTLFASAVAAGPREDMRRPLAMCTCRRGGRDEGVVHLDLLAPHTLLAQQLGAAVGR